MPAAARITDTSTGHDAFGPQVAISGSSNVWINGLALHRTGDAWSLHCATSCHDGVLASGSQTVFANGLQVGRIGDPISCGGSVATGSPNVWVN